jgi:hypothetical protein
VADFYAKCMAMLRSTGIDIQIWPVPVEVPDPVRFDQDRKHASYDPDSAQKFWRILLNVDSVFQTFRSKFIGKCSPVHFFWGSFDLCVTRFSGRSAPPRPGADAVTREAYSHEVSSVGFWPGGGSFAGPAFYSYSSPEPAGFRDAIVHPDAAHFDSSLGEFIMMYDDARAAVSPAQALLEFCQSTYEAGASSGKWDRESLERSIHA